MRGWREGKKKASFVQETDLQLWMHLNLSYANTPIGLQNVQCGAVESECPAAHMQNKLEEGEKSVRLSLSLMQTVCLAASGIAGPCAVIGY